MVRKDINGEGQMILERTVMGMSVAISITYIVLICIPSGWHTKVSQIWSFYLGLFSVEVRQDTLGGWVIKKTLNSIGRMFGAKGESAWGKMMEACAEGDHSIQQLRDQFCNIELLSGGFLNNCWVWSQVLYGSWGMAFAMVCTSCCMMTGTALLMTTPGKCSRMAAMGMFSTAAVVNLLGTGSYVMLTFPLQRWLHEIYGSHDGLTFSQGSVVAAACTVCVCFMPVMVWFGSYRATVQQFDEDEEYWDDGTGAGAGVDAYGNPLPVDQYGNPMYGDASQYGDPSQYPPPGDASQYPPGAGQYGDPSWQGPAGHGPPQPGQPGYVQSW